MRVTANTGISSTAPTIESTVKCVIKLLPIILLGNYLVEGGMNSCLYILDEHKLMVSSIRAGILLMHKGL